ncbi:AmmeMemoRadiSam system radical SAM enzyme [Paraliomyxa miuraensis]|uniref:AmmeMemoRadiSam system radical SAM enzyme n=1 Tax=Paraliomyxa miuraensis TaxID=376150 RepID=UPI00224CF925|nr:AmmeMemoRadiSam system radical SAM enzyme [Paraliomyxa miuraensis]MCX4247783.1 AmmeMemoRadiSam system radical SAM enzyme [Paraliomyxa miuraensis]
MPAPAIDPRDPTVVEGRWWHRLDDGRVQCDLCPRECKLRDGQRGFCFVRENRGDRMVLASYGRASGFCVDPIEKKPLNHFLPGSSVLSFGTAGCNLGCRFCQNWDISKAREHDRLMDRALPERIADAAVGTGARSVAFTYNDPVIFAEYAIDAAAACRARGLKTVAVTAGYITPQARAEFFGCLDAANIDLKAFTEGFYHKLCFAHLQPVLDTLRWVKRETNVWLEVTTLLIPGHNDGEDEVDRLCDFMVRELGPQVPLHLSAFHPDFKMTDVPRTPPATLHRARQQALRHGLHHVYTGNVHDQVGQSTYCPACHAVVIERDWYRLGTYRLDAHGRCTECDHQLPGVFDGPPGDWGRQRLRVRID